MARTIGNIIGFDDAPFARSHRGDVLLIGTVCARTRLDGVVSTKVRRDGRNSTDKMIEIVRRSPFLGHAQAILLQGIAVAGFNVVDIHRLSEALERPVMAVTRRRPDLEAMHRALKQRVRGGQQKWRLIEKAGEVEKVRKVFVNRAGLTIGEASELLRVTTLHGHLPEALRLAHLIAGGVTDGISRGRA